MADEHTRRVPPTHWLTALLGFVAGFTDTCGFIALFGLFTAHITGNLALIAAGIVNDAQASVAKVCAIPVFMIAVAATRLLVTTMERRGADWFRPVATLHLVLLAGFMAAGIAWGPFADAGGWRTVTTGMLAVASMGVQSAMTRLDSLIQTTAMTGNTCQLVLDLVDIAAPPDAKSADAARARVRNTWPVVAGFVLGAAGGGLGYGAFGFAAMAFPVLLSAMLLLGPSRASLLKVARP